MANELLLTAQSATYNLDDGDLLYVGAAGSVIVNGAGAHALTMRSGDEAVVVSDGSLISVGGDGIHLVAEVPGDKPGRWFDVTIGEGGLVRSLAGTGILIGNRFSRVENHGEVSGDEAAVAVDGESNLVANFGEMSGVATGVTLTGALHRLRNDGGIQARDVGILADGDGIGVVNGGTVMAASALRVLGSAFRLVNEGTMTGDSGTGSAPSAAISIEEGSNHVLVNHGSIDGANLGGIFYSNLNKESRLTLRNDGTIAANGTAVYAANFGQGSRQPETAIRVVNDGAIEGGSGTGITVINNRLALENGADGRITSVGGDAVSVEGALRLINEGAIVALAEGAVAIRIEGPMNLGNSRIINTGLIAAQIDPSDFDDAIAIDATDIEGAFLLTNHGTIAGRVIGDSLYIANFGRMDGIEAEFSSEIDNRGVIAGAISLGDQGDSYDGRAGVLLDRLFLGGGNDGARGGVEGDWLEGGAGNDKLWGYGGDDTLIGGTGNDSIYGGSGADSIRGGTGLDSLTGGSDADLFVITLSDSGASAGTADHIADFQHGLDKFDFDSPVKFVGSGPYDTSTRSMRYDQATGRLTADVTFDGVTDWMVILDNKPVLTASDFL